jgi:hypothetical protein
MKPLRVELTTANDFDQYRADYNLFLAKVEHDKSPAAINMGEEDNVGFLFSVNHLKRWTKDNSGNQMHSQFKEAYKAQTGTAATSSRAPEPLIIAHGIYQVCIKYEPDTQWIEPEWDTSKHGPKYKFKMV